MKLVAFALAATLALPAAAQFAKPEDAVKYRQSALSLMNTHAGRIGAMVNGRVPYDAKAAVENAEVIADLARLPWTAFGPGTDKISQKAKAEIWSEPEKFRERADKFVAESGRLLAAAKTNNLDNLKAAFSATAASCKACHDSFRNQ